MCLRTLELFSVFIGFIFMFLYLYKHTHLITHPENGANDHTTICRASVYSYTTHTTQPTRIDRGVGRAVPPKTGLYRARIALVRTQHIAAGQPYNPVLPGSCQCGSVLSTDWSAARRAEIRATVSINHIFQALPVRF